jgi:enamine deaminase RidA (YjgF/YER057c/UK114 family)
MRLVFEKIETSKAPRPIVPAYSQAFIAGAILSLSGNVGISLDNKIVEGGITKEANQAIDNIEAIMSKAHERLKELGIDGNSKVRTLTNVYFIKNDDLGDLKDVCKSRLPQRISYEKVDGLPLKALTEIRVEESFLDFLKPEYYQPTGIQIDNGNGSRAIKEIENKLKSNGFGLHRVFYSEAHLRDMRTYTDFNNAYFSRFPHAPSRAVFQLSDIPANLEMFCKAYLGRIVV